MQGIPQKDKDDPVVLSVGAQVSAKYKGAFCEAKVHKVVKNIKVKVAFKKGGTATVTDDEIVGEIRVGNIVEINDADKKETNEATITKIQDCSQYTVVFDDGDIATLRRTALCRQSGKHFNACDTLDQLPLTHPEHRGGGKRTKTQDEYESDDEEYAIGKVVCVENNDTKKKNVKESYFPALVVAPKAQENVKIHIKTEYLVRSFKDGRYYTVPKKEVTEFTNDTASKSDSTAVAAAREFLDKNVLPPHWDREVLIDSASLSDQELSDSSDDEPNEVKDRFFAQLLEFMEKRNSPLNKGPSITNRDVDLYRLYYSVEKLGGYANVTKIRNWKAIAKRLGFTPTDAIVKLVKHSYRKFLLAFEEAVSKGIEDLPPRANRDKARSSSTRSGSVASPKVVESAKKKVEKPTTSSVADDSENTSESIKVTTSRKLSTASVKSKVDKAEEKIKPEKAEKEKPEKNKDNNKNEKDSDKVDKEKSVSKDDEVSAATASSPSQSVTTASAKKEKTKKKPPEGKKKKEDTAEKKETITTAAKTQVPSGPSIADDVLIEIDDRLKVYYRGSSDYEAKVLDISEQEGKPVYKVHYKGWNARYDEWIHRESIAENLTKDEAKKKQSNNNGNNTSGIVKSASTPSTNLQTPTTKNATKRARNRADTTASSRSTTPLSNTSSKTKIAQKRPTRGTPTSKSSNRGSMIDDNSSESDEPIKKPSEKKEKSNDDKNTSIQKSSSAVDVAPNDNKDVSKSESKVPKEIKSNEKAQTSDAIKSDDEKSTKSSIKSGKSPFDVKNSKHKTIQRDSSRSSFHSTDSDSSHSVPSDVPNSSKSAYTSENESNEPEKILSSSTSTIAITTIKTETKKSSFRFDEETSDVKNPLTFFEKTVSEKTEVKTDSGAIFPTRKPNIFQDKKAAQKVGAADTSKLGRFGQSLAKEIGKGKKQDVKSEDKTTESDIYEFKDTEEFSDAKVVSTTVKKQESPNEPTKKQQLAQQRKQARQNVIDTSTGGQMEDIESMIKTSIVSLPNKKQKKSPVKEEKAQHSMIMARTPATTSQTVIPQPWSAIQSTPQTSQDLFPKTNITPPILSQTLVGKSKTDSTFDVLRKSPSFNMHHSDDFITAKPSSQTTTKNITAGPVKFSSDLIEQHELLKPIMVPSKEDEKPELEAFKKILEPSFQLFPKAEVKSSIADKLLKAINQKDAANEREISQYNAIIKDEPYVKIEELKMDQYTFKAKSPGTSKPAVVVSSTLTSTKKPLLISSETKIDDKAKGNVELQGIIEKLESAISTPISLTAATTVEAPPSTQFPSTKKQNDDSDTDSDRLVIEDETTPSETTDKKKASIGALESIMLQDDVPYKHNNPNTKEAEKKTDSGEQQSESMSLLLCEETIPGSPAPSTCKDPLSEIGRSPTSGFVHPSMPQSGSGYTTMKYTGPTLLHHQQYQSASHQGNVKSTVPMDIDNEVGIEAATGDILRDKLKSERGSATSSGNNTNNNSDNSLDDDQSESEKNVKSDISRKKKRTMKIEPDIHAKRRRQQARTQTNVRGNLQGNDSDSNDNSDVNIFTRNQVEPSQGSANKIQFNFLVELDPNMPSCHRISLLEKKIQDLRKTYMMIKNEMNAKERRRKKMRKRERENKQKQTAKVS